MHPGEAKNQTEASAPDIAADGLRSEIPVQSALLPARRVPGTRRRAAGWIFAGGAMVLTTMLLGLALFLFLGLEDSPFISRIVRERIVASLQERLDPKLTLSIDDVKLKRDEADIVVRVKGFTIRDPAGKTLVSAPSGKVSLEAFGLLGMLLVPNDVVLEGMSANVEVSETGSISVSPGLGTPVENADIPTALAGAPTERLKQVIGAAFAGFAGMRDALGGKLPSLGIDNASVSVLDRRTNQTFQITGINSRLSTRPDGSTQARTELKAGGAPFAVDVELSAAGTEGQVFKAKTDRLTLGDALAIAGLKAPDSNSGVPVTVNLTATVDSNFTARSASTDFNIGKTSVHLDGATPQTVSLDEASASLSWRDDTSGVVIDALNVVVGTSRILLRGKITPPAQAEGDSWAITLSGGNIQLAGVAASDKPFEISQILADITAKPGDRRITLDRFELDGPKVSVRMKGGLTIENDGRPAIGLDLTATNTDARVAMRLWPEFAAPDVRKWLATAAVGGSLDQLRLKLDFPAPVLAQVLLDRPIPDASLGADWTISKAVMRPIEGINPIREGMLTGVATGKTVRVDFASGQIDAGGGRNLALTEGSFIVNDTSREPADARVRVKFSGGADALAAFAAQPGIKAFTPTSIDPALLKGAADGELNMALRLSKRMSQGDVRVSVAANLKNVSVEKAIGTDKLEGANLALSVDRDIFSIKGEGKVFGATATIDLRGSARNKARVVLTTALDDAARARKGISPGTMLTGPVGVKLSVDLDDTGDRNAEVELDFAKAKIDGLIPGWTKASGQAGRAKFDLDQVGDKGWELNNIEIDSGVLSVRGMALLAADGQFQKASLKTFKISPGDNMQLDAERGGGVLKLALRGNSFDARPFLRSLQTGTIDKAGGKDVEVLLKTTVFSGFNGEIIANADLKMAMRGSELKRFDLTGGFDGGGVTARLVARPNALPLLVVDSEDAGAFLRFFDIYNRMRGGRLNLSAALGSGSQAGTILVREFTLRNAPAMKRLVADPGIATGGDRARFDPSFVQRLNANQDVRFTKMTVEFARTAARLDLKDAVIWGNDLGGNISGFLDYGRDRVDLTGTFVPAYTVNNFFARVPVLGPLLGGGQNEGLFAVRYNITGKVSAPTLSFNPLTAIAPGFLRKLIDFKGAPTSETPVVPRPVQ